jgi:hypothetical protein
MVGKSVGVSINKDIIQGGMYNNIGSRVGQIALVFRSDHPIDQRSMSADLIEIIFCDLIVDRIDTIYCPL